MRRICVALLFCLSLSASFAGEITFVKEKDDTRPEIWKQADGQLVVMAEAAARLDGWAKLAEFVSGMEIKGSTSVKDLVDVTQALRGRLRANLDGMTSEEYIHHDNGIVQCKVSMNLRDLVETLETYLKETRKDGEIVDHESFLRYNLENQAKVLTVWGNGALRDKPEAVRTVQALRAAELAAQEQMVAMLEGVQIGRETTVKDFLLASDRLRACVEDSSKGLRYTDYRVFSNKVEVDASVKFINIIERIERVYEELTSEDLCTGCPEVDIKEFENVTHSEVAEIHKVTGVAAINESTADVVDNSAAGSRSRSAADAGTEPNKVIRREVVQEKAIKRSVGL